MKARWGQSWSLCAGLVALMGWPSGEAARATEFGVMWQAPKEESLRTSTEQVLATHEVPWVRVIRGWPLAGQRQSLTWWPGGSFSRKATPSGVSGTDLATNLWSVYAAARQAAQEQPESVKAWEIGNEPDLHFTSDLPDRMAATLKAAWWGAKAARPELTVVMPSLAARPGPYAESLVANGILPFTAAWNLHHYGWAQDFDDAVAAHRRFLRRHGGALLPVWVTEFGFAEFNVREPALQATMLARQRAFFERLAVEAAAADVAQAWAFCLHPFLDGALDYGLLAADQTPRPALEAFLETARRLGNARLLYRLRQRVDRATVGLVFSERSSAAGAERWWTVLFTPHRRADFALPALPDGKAAQQPAPAPETSYYDFALRFPPACRPVNLGLRGEHGDFGTEMLTFRASAATNLHLLTPPQRFEVDGCDWEPVSKRVAPRAADRSPSPVVISARPLGPATFADKPAVAYRHSPALPVRLEVVLHNFSPQPQAGAWRLVLSKGWRRAAGTPDRLPVSLPAESEWRTNLLVWPPPGGAAGREHVEVRWAGRDGLSDQASLGFASAVAPSAEVSWRGDGWLPLDESMGWQTEASEAGKRFRLERVEVGALPGLILPLPGAGSLRADDRLRFRLRIPAAESPRRRRLELITPQREVFRWGDELELGAGWQTIEARIGDFTPGFWSRVGPGDPARARYLRLAFIGLGPGETVELTPVELLRQ